MRSAQEVHLAVQRRRVRFCAGLRLGSAEATGRRQSDAARFRWRAARHLDRDAGDGQHPRPARFGDARPRGRFGRMRNHVLLVFAGARLRLGLRCGLTGLGGGSSLDLAGRHAPVGYHPGRLSAGGDERPDIQRIDPAVLAEPAFGAAVGVTAGIGTHRLDAHERLAQMLACQRLQVLLHPFVQRRDHVAGQIHRRGHHDLLLALADADQFHRCGRTALGALSPGRGRLHHHIQPFQQDGAAGLCRLDILRRPFQRLPGKTAGGRCGLLLWRIGGCRFNTGLLRPHVACGQHA